MGTVSVRALLQKKDGSGYTTVTKAIEEVEVVKPDFRYSLFGDREEQIKLQERLAGSTLKGTSGNGGGNWIEFTPKAGDGESILYVFDGSSSLNKEKLKFKNGTYLYVKLNEGQISGHPTTSEIQRDLINKYYIYLEKSLPDLYEEKFDFEFKPILGACALDVNKPKCEACRVLIAQNLADKSEWGKCLAYYHTLSGEGYIRLYAKKAQATDMSLYLIRNLRQVQLYFYSEKL